MQSALIVAIALSIAPHVSTQTTGPDGDFGLVFRDLLAFTPSSLGHGGNIRPGFSTVWPALKGAGVGIITLELEANATHLPHWHRSFELLFVINGNLTVGIDSFNATIGTVEYNLTNGDAIILETAAAHYVHNRGPGRSINLSAFGSDNPGTQLSATSLFAFNDDIVQQAIQVDSTTISKLRPAVVPTPALFDGLNQTAQAQTQTGNFTQAMGAISAPLADSQEPAAINVAG